VIWAASKRSRPDRPGLGKNSKKSWRLSNQTEALRDRKLTSRADSVHRTPRFGPGKFGLFGVPTSGSLVQEGRPHCGDWEIFALVSCQIRKNIESFATCFDVLSQETTGSELPATRGAGGCVALSDVVELFPGPEGTFLRRPISLRAWAGREEGCSIGF